MNNTNIKSLKPVQIPLGINQVVFALDGIKPLKFTINSISVIINHMCDVSISVVHDGKHFYYTSGTVINDRAIFIEYEDLSKELEYRLKKI